MVRKGVDTKTKDGFSGMLLLYATKYRHKAIVKLLLNKGVETKVKDKLGQTLLQVAALNGHGAIVKLQVTCNIWYSYEITTKRL